MTRPPRLARWLISRFVPADDRDYFLGDLDEAFEHRAARSSPFVTRLWYWRQTVASMAPLIRQRATGPSHPTPASAGDPVWREFLDDLRFVSRISVRNRVASAVVVGTLILGIGATTAVFSVVNAVLLRPLPFDGSDRVVQFGMTLRNGTKTSRMAYPDMRDYARDTRSFEAVAMASLDGLTLTQGELPEQLLVARVSEDYARVFDIRPTLGRFFLPEEFSPRPRVVMISAGIWQQRFASDPGVIGRSISLGNEPYTVVGVLPPMSYTYPASGVELLTPLSPTPGTYQANRGALWLNAVAKTKPAASFDQAARDVAAVADRIEKEFPDANGGLAVRIEPLHDVEVGDVRAMLVLLTSAVAAVLLIACVNIANVLLGMSHARGREFAVRAALGGSGSRLRRQLLTESLALAIIGGVLGASLAPLLTRVIVALYPGGLPRAAEIGVDIRVLMVAAAATLAAGLLAGLPAAHRAARLDLTRDLREGTRGSGSVAQRRVSRLLVTSQIALSIVLLFSAGLLLQTFRALSNTDPGFESRNITTFQLSASRARYPQAEQVAAYYTDVDRELRGIPGVTDVTFASEVPLTNGSLDIIVPKEDGDRGKDNPQVRVATVAPGYWKALGVRTVSGRTFAAQDRTDAPRVVVVNDVLARRVYGGQNPVGRTVIFANLEWQIVGVVGSMRMRSLAEPAEPELYLPTTQNVQRFQYVIVKSSLAPEQLIAQARQSLRRIDPTVAMTEVAAMQERVRDALAPQRFRASLVSALGALALVLSTLGIYGVVAYAVSRQTREIGVRMALGEDRGSVRWRVLSSALRMGSVGIGVGAVLALASSRWLSSFLVGVRPRDPVMLTGVALLIVGVTAVAAYVPARRASRVDPMTALRSE